MNTEKHNSVFETVGVKGNLTTLEDWKEALPKLETLTPETLRRAYPNMPEQELRTIYGFITNTVKTQRFILSSLKNWDKDFETITEDRVKLAEFLRNLTEKDFPKILLEDPPETQEEKQYRELFEKPKPESTGKKLLKEIMEQNTENAVRLWEELDIIEKVSVFVTYRENVENSTLEVTNQPKVRKITASLAPMVTDMFRNHPLPADEEITVRSRSGSTKYTIAASYEQIEQGKLLTNKKTGQVVTFSEFERAMMDKFVTLYEHPSIIWRGKPCARFEDIYRLMVNDPKAKLTENRKQEIDSFIAKFSSLRVTVDFSGLPNADPDGFNITDTQLLMTEVKTKKDPKTKKDIKILRFIKEPVVLEIAKKCGAAQGKGPYLAHIPVDAYTLPKGISGTPRNISVVNYLARQLNMNDYVLLKENSREETVIRLDNLYQIIGETVPERKAKVREVIEEYMNMLCTMEDPPFPGLKDWSWITKTGKEIKTRTRNNSIYGIKLHFVFDQDERQEEKEKPKRKRKKTQKRKT